MLNDKNLLTVVNIPVDHLTVNFVQFTALNISTFNIKRLKIRFSSARIAASFVFFNVAKDLSRVDHLHVRLCLAFGSLSTCPENALVSFTLVFCGLWQPNPSGKTYC